MKKRIGLAVLLLAAMFFVTSSASACDGSTGMGTYIGDVIIGGVTHHMFLECSGLIIFYNPYIW